jgi:hypothetical protein
MVAADFDGDGRLDLVTAGSGVSVLLSNGDGSFQEERLSMVGHTLRCLVAADLNGDGRQDLATVDVVTEDPPAVVVLLGNGDGTFTEGQILPIRGGCLDRLLLLAADPDDDGRTDLIFAYANGDEYTCEGVLVFLGSDGGTFHEGQRLGGPGLSERPLLAVADLNGDERLDLFAGNRVLLGNGDGTFGREERLEVAYEGYWPMPLVAEDLDGDDRLDFATVGSDSRWAGDASIFVFLGNGDGSFQEKRQFRVESRFSSIVAADLDHDGRMDLATASGRVSVLLGNGDGSFQEELHFSAGGSQSIVAADLDGDGRLDLATAGTCGAGESCVSVLLGNGDGTFQEEQRFSAGDESERQSLVAADLNGDSRLDLATAGSGVSLLLGNGDGTFQEERRSMVGHTLRCLVAADLDGDNRLDLVTAGEDVYVLLGNGNGTFQTELRFSAIGPQSLVAADLDGDGRLDLATAGSCLVGQGCVSVLLGNGDGTFQEERHLGPVNSTSSIVTGDLDDDGRLDLAATACGDWFLLSVYWVFVSVLLNDCAGGGIQRPGDANQDGKLDVSDAIWLLGHLFVGEHPVLPCEGRTAGNPGPGELALLDGNGDSRLDLSDAIYMLQYLFLGGEPPLLGTDCVIIDHCPNVCVP